MPAHGYIAEARELHVVLCCVAFALRGRGAVAVGRVFVVALEGPRGVVLIPLRDVSMGRRGQRGGRVIEDF